MESNMLSDNSEHPDYQSTFIILQCKLSAPWQSNQQG